MMVSDDDDLRQTIAQISTPADEDDLIPAHVKEQVNEINKVIQKLKFGKRFDSLIELNQIIWGVQTYEPALEFTSNDLIKAFTYVLNDTFEREEITFRFAKSITAIMVKVVKCKEIMKHLDENTITDFQEQLCKRMLFSGLNEKDEGKTIINNLNYCMV